jgi:hypothetical protein
MKRLFILVLFCSSLLFSQSVNNAVGIGYPGITYRMYNPNQSYVELIGHLSLNKEESRSDMDYKVYLGANYGKYLYLSNTTDTKFAVKYRAGVALGHRNNSYSWMSEYNGYQVESNIGLGVEVFSPLESGFNLDIFVGEEIIYYQHIGIAIHPILNLHILLNY